MAEAIAVVGILSSVLQVADFSAKVITQAHSLIDKGEDALRDNRQLEVLANTYGELGDTSALPTSNAEQSTEEQLVATLRSRCSTKSKSLVARLQALKLDSNAHGVKRLADGTRKVAKALTQRKAIERQRAQLQEINSQLATAILQSLFAKREHYAAPGQEVLRAIEATRGDDVQKALVLAQKQTYLRDVTDHLLSNLSFEEVTARRDTVPQAYPSTYEWALRDEDLSFTTWLRKGGGVFWISGKAGSGKSTLMKLLCEHNDTKKMLEQWCTAEKLILESSPDLIQVAFPKRFTSDTQPPPDLPRRSNTISWTHDELVSGLKALARRRREHADGKKFCFFIDGLDEFHGDHVELVDLLNDLVSNGNVKLCVSSRPWNAFRNAYSLKVSYLRVEDLSRPDISRYVNGRIRQRLDRATSDTAATGESEVTLLIDEIVDKAEGVFLWVELVVKPVLGGLGEGDSISLLRHRVQQFPADLEDFFRSMLGRVDRVYKCHTAQALKLACVYANETDMSRSLSSFVDYWLIRQNPFGLSDPRFPYDIKTGRFSCGRAVLEMQAETRTMLSAACKDLLLLPQMAEAGSRTLRVEFLHRTVHDFLQRDELQTSLNEQVPDHFKNGRIVHLLNLARLKLRLRKCTIDHGGEDDCRRDGALHDAVSNSARLSVEKDHHDLTKEFVAEFETIILDTHDAEWRDRTRLLINLVAFQKLTLALRQLAHYLRLARSRNNPELITDQLFDGANRGEDCSIKEAKSLMFNAALGDDSRNNFGLDATDLSLLRGLVEIGAAPYDAVEDEGCSINVWQRFLRKWYLAPCDNGAHPYRNGATYRLRHIWELAKLFLTGIGSVADIFCASREPGDSPEHRDVPCPAAEFLKERVPAAWLLEHEATQSLAKEAAEASRIAEVAAESETKSA